MVKANYLGLFLALMLPVTLAANTVRPQDKHHNHQHDKQRLEGVNQRGDHAMGFSHEKATHHFRLTSDGGSIEVIANQSTDDATVEQIRAHLSNIAKLFREGDFSKPMLTHGETPPGVPEMKRLKADISYTFGAIDRGGRVRIATANVDAAAAVHAFLRYQIKDHQTGDSLEVK